MRDALMSTYAPSDILFTHGEGSYLIADDGKRYLDFLAGIAVNSFGHCHPHLVAALKDQADKLWHTSNVFRIAGSEVLSERLTELTFADKVFFANSGAEAIECGLKMMRRYHFDKGDTNRNRILGFKHSFHGRTIATIAAAGQPDYIKGFLSGEMGFDSVEGDDIATVEKHISEKTAGIIIEPIQGEGGILAFSTEFLQNLRALCDKHGILLMCDEVQCGNGRTGKLYAHEWADIQPDILATAKGIGGGFPLGICMARDEVASCMVVGTHGSTFGGNPLAMAVGNAVLDLLNEDGFLADVEEKGRCLSAQLFELKEQFPTIIADIRGRGLMIGIKCLVENTQVVTRCRDAGLLVGKGGDNVVRLLPPLNISDTDIKEAIRILTEVCQHWPGK